MTSFPPARRAHSCCCIAPVEINASFIPLGNDPIIPISKTKALDELLRNAGADVTIRYFQAGHELTMADVESARKWLTTLE